jgi:bisphosphoglycerate-independent phosphoglycerate mutase (AlkP superfamily)
MAHHGTSWHMRDYHTFISGENNHSILYIIKKRKHTSEKQYKFNAVAPKLYKAIGILS